jgi:aminoglycoside phosphotransferase (APT) family kinase protein
VNGIRLGELERVGEGREAEVFALDGGRVLRLARRADGALMIDRERAALLAATEAGVPSPEVYERVEVDGRPGLVVERLGSRNLLLEIGERPWRVAAVSRSLGLLHARMHGAVVTTGLPTVHERLRERLESARVPAELRQRGIERLDRLPQGDRLCHGDFHPANVLVRPGGEPVAIDWTGASRGDPSADVANSLLIIRHGTVGPDATRAVAALARVGRRVLWAGYKRSYARGRAIDEAAVRSWLPVVATGRLAEDIAGERRTLLRLATRS